MKPEIKNRIDQIRRGQVPEGYVRDRKVLLPVGWEYCPIKDVAIVSSGSTPARNNPKYWNGNIPWVTTGELESGHVVSTIESVSKQAVENLNLTVYPKGTLLMAMYGQGKTRGTVAMLEIDATVNQACAAITLKQGKPKFLFFQLQNAYENIRKLSNTGNQENLNADIVKTFRILWAPDAEQQKIAAILSTQDKIIELKEKLIAEKQRQKKYLLHQLLTGRKRLAGYNKKWRAVKLKNIAKKEKLKNIGFEYSLVLSNSAQNGIISQEEQFNKEIASTDRIDEYHIVRNGYFVYNPRISTTAPCGPININETGNTGVMSPLYTVFSIDCDYIDNSYMKQYFKSTCWFRHMKSVANYGARHDRMSITDDDFFAMPIAVPELEEQQAISTVFAVADKEISLLQQSLEQEKQKKKALMQILLTGIVRVNV